MSFLEIYLDKQFVSEYVRKASQYDYYNYHDFKIFWSSLRNYSLFTNYSETELAEEFKKQNALLTNIVLSRLPNEVHYNYSFNFELKSCKNLPTLQKGSPFKLFFIESEINVVSLGFENITSFNFDKKWSVYNSQRQDRKFTATNNIEVSDDVRFDSWSKLKRFSHPFHSLVVFDLYVLSDKSNEKIADNLIPFLVEIVQGNPFKGQIDIMIITGKTLGNIEEVYNNLKTSLENNLGDNHFKLNIIRYLKELCPKDFQDLTFRKVLTNYFEIIPEKGINLFRQNGRVGKLQHLMFDFIFFGANSENLKPALLEFKKYLEKVMDFPQRGSEPPLKNYHPEKENRLLNYEKQM